MRMSTKTIAVPPGYTIKEQIAAIGMSQKELAARMGMSEKHISNLINGDVQLTPDVALRLEMVLGVPAHFWNNLEAIYREELLRVQFENDMEDDLEIVKMLPYSEMAKNNWVEKTNKAKEKVMNCRKFFEVVRLSLINEGTLIPKIACRRLAKGTKSDYALIAWAQEAKREARHITTSPINIEKLEALIPDIRLMTTQDPEVFCPVLCKSLAECGVALVFLPHINGSFLHGATFFDGPKIVTGITLRGKDADIFWFSLFHELGHIVHGHLGKNEGTTAEDEETANAFAQEALIPSESFSLFLAKNQFDKKAIVEFAKSIKIDPGIVLGRLQKERQISYSWHRDLKKQYVFNQ